MYRTVSLHQFQNYLNDMRDGSGVLEKPSFTTKGQGEDFFLKIEPKLATLITNWKKEIKQIGDNTAKKEEYEATMSVDLFKILYPIQTQMLTDSDFWRFLSMYVFYDFIIWRDGENCAYASFGASGRAVNFDCVPFRMFNRALVAFAIDSTDKDLAYAKIPGTDLWRSHILRVLNSYSSSVSKAILDQYNDGKLPTALVRDVVKRLRKLRSNLLFEILSDKDAEELLKEEMVKSKLSLAKK